MSGSSPPRADAQPHRLLRLAGGPSPRLRWGERIPLEPIPGGILVDLRGLEYAGAPLALRLAACAAVHAEMGEPFLLTAPRSAEMRRRLRDLGLPAGRGTPVASARQTILPITHISEIAQVEAVGESLHAALTGVPSRLAAGSEPIMRAFSELCDNACTHGHSGFGTFVLAERLGSSRLVLAVGDLGVGIPQHLGPALGGSEDDEGRLIVRALEPGTSGARDRPGGAGLPKTVDAIRESGFSGCQIRIWSGVGRVLTGPAPQSPRGRIVSSYTPGTWTEVVLTTGRGAAS